MNRQHILTRLARARLEIETVALQIMEEEPGQENGKIKEDILEAKARVDALEARVSVLEARR